MNSNTPFPESTDDMSTVSNITESENMKEYIFTSRSLTLICIMTFVCVLTVLANTVIIIMVCLDKHLRKPTNYYIISLAAADWIVGAVVMPFMTSYTVLGYWPLSARFCDLWIITDFVCCTASMLSLCLISVDRHWAITKPLKHMSLRSHKRALWLVTVVWVVSFLCWTPAVITWHSFHSNFEDGVCIYLTHRYYILASAVLIYYLPMIGIVVLYVRVYRAVKQSISLTQEDFASKDDITSTLSESCASDKKVPQNKECQYTDLKNPQIPNSRNRRQSDHRFRSENNNAVPVTMITTTSDLSCDAAILDPEAFGDDVTDDAASGNITEDVKHDNIMISTISRPVQNAGEERHKERLKRDLKARMSLHRRAAKTLGIIVVLFLICWLPFVILFPIHGFCECVPIKLYDASYWMAYINSTLNPFLYGFNREFRKAFLRLFLKRDFTSKTSNYLSKSNVTSQSQFKQ